MLRKPPYFYSPTVSGKCRDKLHTVICQTIMNNERLKIIISLNVALSTISAVTSAIFFSVIPNYGHGYQIFLAFFINPVLLLLQLFKIYQIYKVKLPTIFLTISILSIFLFYIPLTHAWHLKVNVTALVSGLTYALLTVFYIWESFYLHRQKITNKTATTI